MVRTAAFPQSYPHLLWNAIATVISDPLQPDSGVLVLKKPFFLGFEFPAVNDQAAVRHTRFMSYVKHLVKKNVFSDVRRNVGRIEDAADENDVACSVISAEDVAGFPD